jgi:sugar phosphate permease
MGIGVAAYASGVFFQAMFVDLGWSRGDLALSMSVGAILAAIASPLVGTYVDKYGANRIMAMSAFLSGGCLILCGYIYELWHAFFIFSLLTVFRTGFVYIPVMVMVSNWFSSKRGRAMGIATAGQGLGGIILSPLSTYLISNLGWRISWGVLGLLTWAIMIPPALLITRQKPEDMGLFADGDAPTNGKVASTALDTSKITPENKKWVLKDILRMPAFWFIAVMHSLYLFGHHSLFQHGYSLFIDRGIPLMTAGTMIGILGLFSLSGKVVLGYLADRISVRYIMIIALIIAGISVSLLFRADVIWISWLFIVFWGFWECGVIALQPLLVSSFFDRSIIGKMLGIFSIFSVIPQLIGAPYTGYIFDITGSYNTALFTFVIFYFMSAVLVFLARHPTLTE